MPEPSTADLATALDASVNERRLLDHPFYQAWSQGRLTRDDLAFYSTQYWRQVEAFPGHLETLAGRLPEGNSRHIVVENLSDERDGDHPGLWKDFAAALGVGGTTLESAASEAETSACVEAFRAAMQDGPVTYALGMLYGYESQTPEVATTKIRGLRDHYGLQGGALDYFELHAELDVEHAGELISALAPYAHEPGALDQAASGARAGADAVWGLLDGVARARSIV